MSEDVFDYLLEQSGAYFDIERDDSRHKKYVAYKKYLENKKEYYEPNLEDKLNCFYLSGLGEEYKDWLDDKINDKIRDNSKKASIGLLAFGILNLAMNYLDLDYKLIATVDIAPLTYFLSNLISITYFRNLKPVFNWHLSGRDFDCK